MSDSNDQLEPRPASAPPPDPDTPRGAPAMPLWSRIVQGICLLLLVAGIMLLMTDPGDADRHWAAAAWRAGLLAVGGLGLMLTQPRHEPDGGLRDLVLGSKRPADGSTGAPVPPTTTESNGSEAHSQDPSSP